MIIRRGREGRGTDTGYNRQQRPYLHLMSLPQTNQQQHGPNERNRAGAITLAAKPKLMALLQCLCIYTYLNMNAAHGTKNLVFFVSVVMIMRVVTIVLFI